MPELREAQPTAALPGRSYCFAATVFAVGVVCARARPAKPARIEHTLSLLPHLFLFRYLLRSPLFPLPEPLPRPLPLANKQYHKDPDPVLTLQRVLPGAPYSLGKVQSQWVAPGSKRGVFCVCVCVCVVACVGWCNR